MFVWQFLSHSFYAIILSIIYVRYKSDYVPWFVYVFLVAGGFGYGWFVSITITRRIKSLSNTLLCDDAYLGETFLHKSGMNHFRGIVADGGVGYLFSDKLVFVPHRMNLSKDTVTIQFSDIQSVSDYKIYKIVDTGLKIVLNSGKQEKFVIDKTSDFYRELIQVLRHFIK